MKQNKPRRFTKRSWNGIAPHTRSEKKKQEEQEAKRKYNKIQRGLRRVKQFQKTIEKAKIKHPGLKTSVNRIAKTGKKLGKQYKKYQKRKAKEAVKLSKAQLKAQKEAQQQAESLKRVAAGKPRQLRDVVNVDTPELVKMSREELLKYYKIANRNVKNRLKAFEERELDSFAIESLIRRGGISDDFETMSRDEILKDLLLAKKFISYRTSTVSGYMSYLDEVNKRLAAGDSSIRALIANLEEDEKSTLWDIYYEVLSTNAGQVAQMISDGLISSDQVQAMVARQFVTTKSIDANSYVQNFFEIYNKGGDFNRKLKKTDFKLDNSDDWVMVFNN